MARLVAAAFRFAPALGGAENHARRLYMEIGQRLDLTTTTVKGHVHNIMEKLALHTRLQVEARSRGGSESLSA